MSKRWLTLAVLFPALALGQVIYQPGKNPYHPGPSPSGASRVVLRAPMSLNGPLMPDDGTEVLHVYWNGSALVDEKANAWTMNGTVPQTAANVSPFIPGAPGAGPYSAANNYQGPTTLGEWAGDWSVTVVFKPTSTPAGASPLVAKNDATHGWSCYHSSIGTFSAFAYDGANKIASGGAVTLNAVNVGTCGRSGGTLYARVNTAAAGTTAVGTMAAATGLPSRIGADGAATYDTTGVIYEILASTTPYSDALHLARWNAVMGQNASTGPITVTRADPLSYTANGFVWSAPPATLAIESAGASIWKGSTNYVLNSGTHPKAAEATASLGTAAYVGWHAGSGTMTIAAGTATVTGLSCTAVSPGTLCPFTVTGAGTMTVTTSAGTVTQATIEPGAYPTPYIPTAGSSVARAATVATVPLPALGNKWCASVTGSIGNGAWEDTTRNLWFFSNYSGSTTNALNLRKQNGNILFYVGDSAGTAKQITWAHNLTGSGAKRLTGCNTNGTLTLCSAGVSVGAVSGAGTGLQTATLTPLQLGSENGGSFADGNLSNLKICRGAANCAECR